MRRARMSAASATLALALVAACVVGCTASSGSDRTSSSAPTSAPATGPAPTAPPSSSTTAAVPSALVAYYRQSPAWSPCGSLQCATVRVPVDYDHPGSGDVVLHLNRSRATGTRLGSLFVNPGGPGAPGLGLTATVAQAVPKSVSAGYDIVGFDPRGVGASTPLRCLTTSGLDRYLATDLTPSDGAGRRLLPQQMRAQGNACRAHSGALASHVSTVEVARDLDILRAVVRDERLNYLGYSYGAAIGATYAALFPTLVGRMVLDGPENPDQSPAAKALTQATGFQTALNSWAADCVRRGCALGGSTTAVEGAVRRLLTRLDGTPARTSNPARPLTQSLAYLGVINQLYDTAQWPALTASVRHALRGNGSDLVKAVDDVYGRGADGYTTNTAQALNAVNCLDYRVGDHTDSVTLGEFEKASPVLGAELYGSEILRGCQSWPLRPSVMAPDFPVRGSAPILVLGTTRDPATPYAGAIALAKDLGSGVLLTRNGDGHTAFLVGNNCIDTAVAAYLAKGTVPAAGTTC